MIHLKRYPVPEHFLPKVVLASDLVLWLFWLPVMLRLHNIPTLLKHLAPRDHKGKSSIELHEAVEIVTRICNLRPFRSRIFPKHCLRQSLALYRTLSQMGYPVAIHFGALKDGEDLHGHSWVTMNGEPVADRARSGIFKVVYSYPYNMLSSGRIEIEKSKHEPIFNEP
jgi:Transglutaminase-like superfamily